MVSVVNKPIILRVIMLNVIMLNVVMISVVMLSVMAPDPSLTCKLKYKHSRLFGPLVGYEENKVL